MTNKDVILKSIRFIESHLKNDVKVLEIANEVCYSFYHFIRLFHSITGYSPQSYIQQRRLSDAALELRDSKKKIVDIAYEYQFGSPESFSRAFRKNFRINPTEVRKGHSLLTLPLLKPITPEYIYQSDKLRNAPPELVECEERLLAGISFFVHNEDEVEDLSREWTLFLNEVHTIRAKITPERFYQVQFWSDNQDLNGLYFFTGVEITQAENINPLFVLKTIPAGKYLRFIHKGLANKVGYTYKYIYNQFLPNTEYKLNIPFNFEHYGEKCLGPYNEHSESEIYIPIG